MNQIWRDSDAIFGNGVRSLRSVPPERLNYVVGKLDRWGIHSLDDRAAILPRLYDEAIAAGRFAPDPEGKPFVPPAMFMVP